LAVFSSACLARATCFRVSGLLGECSSGSAGSALRVPSSRFLRATDAPATRLPQDCSRASAARIMASRRSSRIAPLTRTGARAPGAAAAAAAAPGLPRQNLMHIYIHCST
jgi:hypothetical protein